VATTAAVVLLLPYSVALVHLWFLIDRPQQPSMMMMASKSHHTNDFGRAVEGERLQ